MLERYEKEVVPLKKAKNTRNSNIQAIKKLRQYFQDPPFTLDEIQPIHIREYLDWRKDVKPTANIEVGLFGHNLEHGERNGVTLKRSSPSTGVKKIQSELP